MKNKERSKASEPNVIFMHNNAVNIPVYIEESFLSASCTLQDASQHNIIISSISIIRIDFFYIKYR